MFIYWIIAKRTTALMAKWSSFSCYSTTLQRLCSFRVFVFLCKLRRTHFKIIHELKERFFCNHSHAWSTLNWTLWVISLQYYGKIQLWVRVAQTQYNRVNAREWFCLWKHKDLFSKLQSAAGSQPAAQCVQGKPFQEVLPAATPVPGTCSSVCSEEVTAHCLLCMAEPTRADRLNRNITLICWLRVQNLGPDFFVLEEGNPHTQVLMLLLPCCTRGSPSAVRNHPHPPAAAQDSEITAWGCLISTWADF